MRCRENPVPEQVYSFYLTPNKCSTSWLSQHKQWPVILWDLSWKWRFALCPQPSLLMLGMIQSCTPVPGKVLVLSALPPALGAEAAYSSSLPGPGHLSLAGVLFQGGTGCGQKPHNWVTCRLRVGSWNSIKPYGRNCWLFPSSCSPPFL